MSIIPRNYRKVIEESIHRAFSEFKEIPPATSYLVFFRTIDAWMHERIRKAIVDAFEQIDDAFKASDKRKAQYYSKGRYPRRLMTLFGEIRFEREYYVPKGQTGEGFYFVDRLFTLPRYDYYDPLVKALIVEQVATGSYAAAGRVVAHCLGARHLGSSLTEKTPISRQTVHHILRRLEMASSPRDTLRETPPILHLLFDEKFVASQNENQKKFEIKVGVVHEGIEPIGYLRNRLKKRMVFASIDGAADLRRQIAEYLARTYDCDRLRRILISGDGAPWIEGSCDEFLFHPRMKVTFILDRFHTVQAIRRLSLEPAIRNVAQSYVEGNHRDHFTDLCDALISASSGNANAIEDAKHYLLHHWSAIQRQSDPDFPGCPMEGLISHIPTPVFASRPMGHSRLVLRQRIALRVMLANGVDLVDQYFHQETDLLPDDHFVVDTSFPPHSIFDATDHRVTPLYLELKRRSRIYV